MNVNKVRGTIIALSLLPLIASLTIENDLAVLAFMGISALSALFLLYRYLGDLTDISEDNPKMKTLKGVTIFNVSILIVCIAFAVLIGTDTMKLSENSEKYFAALIVSTVILFAGNLAPKLPFSKHTGLRLPWTVTDEDTWIVAHRILGYMSIPLALIYIAGVPSVPNFEALTFVVILLWAGIPGVLSYIFYRKKYMG